MPLLILLGSGKNSVLLLLTDGEPTVLPELTHGEMLRNYIVCLYYVALSLGIELTFSKHMAVSALFTRLDLDMN
jgi:hypothetical protein